MQLIKDKNKIRWKQSEKLIIDPTLEFNKRLIIHLLNKKFGQHFQKPMILIKGLKNRKLVAFLKLNCLWKTSVKGKNSTPQKQKAS